MIDRKDRISELPFWVISDTHFSHNPIIDYAGRPKDHEDLMYERWRETVKPNDFVLHLGDVVFGNGRVFPETFAKLPGKKFLVKGNHDKRKRKFYRRAGFWILEPFTSEFEGYKVHFSHHPQPRMVKRNPNTLNVHGHTHENIQPDKRLINVCVEQTDYRPVWIEDVLNDRIREIERAKSAQQSPASSRAMGDALVLSPRD
jgi:calcineurin-like phosphoesterase family protein